MQIETVKQLVDDFRNNQKNHGADEMLYARNEKVFRKMSFEELNKELKPYGLKCLIDELDCCSYTHDHLILPIDEEPVSPASADDPRLPKYEAAEELAKVYEEERKEVLFLPNVHPVFKKMSLADLNEELGAYGLKCVVDKWRKHLHSHDRLLCKVDYEVTAKDFRDLP